MSYNYFGAQYIPCSYMDPLGGEDWAKRLCGLFLGDSADTTKALMTVVYQNTIIPKVQGT